MKNPNKQNHPEIKESSKPWFDLLGHRRTYWEVNSTLIIRHHVLVWLMLALLINNVHTIFWGHGRDNVSALQIKYLFVSDVFSSLFFLMHRQVALADLIIINKTDLVSEEELNEVRRSVRYETFGITVTLLPQKLIQTQLLLYCC